jgi:phosphate transport system substrate-binding protein
MKTQHTIAPGTTAIGVALGLLLTTGLIGCQTSTNSPTAGSPTTTTETTAPAAGERITLTGAGASFPAPLYQRWFAEYNRANPNTQISYQSVGSGAGVNQFLAGTVDFGATDAPLTQEERQQYQAKYKGEPVQIPMTGGAVVFAYNLGNQAQNLQLSRQAYCGIVTGEIKSWNDPQIASANPGVTLPDTPITFVHRADGSGTTFIFTNHIAAACPNWKAGVGKSIAWPVGTGAKGNEGVTAQIQQTQGAIGYTEYSYAKNNNLSFATLQNQAGQYIAPSPESAARVLEGQQIPADFALEIPDPQGQQAYPIVGLTWLLLYNNYSDPQKAAALQNFVKWALNDGDKYALELGYLPLTEEVAQRVVTTVDQQVAQR